jgi:AhpD family alkylhydroperoxidase
MSQSACSARLSLVNNEDDTVTTKKTNPFSAHFDLLTPFIDFAMNAQKSLEPSLMELVKIRASQINGCAFCLKMHTGEARRAGEREERIYLLDAWRESSLYTPRERAALGWTEAMTRLAPLELPEAQRALAAEFSEEEQVKLSLMIIAINGFNRLNVGFGVTDDAPFPRKAA